MQSINSTGFIPTSATVAQPSSEQQTLFSLHSKKKNESGQG